MISKAKEGLDAVEKQSENVDKYSTLDKGPATYGVVKRLRDNDMDLHTDKQVSTAPLIYRDISLLTDWIIPMLIHNIITCF